MTGLGLSAAIAALERAKSAGRMSEAQAREAFDALWSPEERARHSTLWELGRALAETHRDPVLQVLHVGGGVAAIGATQDEVDALARRHAPRQSEPCPFCGMMRVYYDHHEFAAVCSDCGKIVDSR